METKHCIVIEARWAHPRPQLTLLIDVVSFKRWLVCDTADFRNQTRELWPGFDVLKEREDALLAQYDDHHLSGTYRCASQVPSTHAVLQTYYQVRASTAVWLG